jgi:hypothetical protein
VAAAATAEQVAGVSLYGLMPTAAVGWSEISPPVVPAGG